MADEPRPKKRNDALVFGAILILAGLIFVLRYFFRDSFQMRDLWPLFMLIPVVPMSIALVKDPRKNAGTAVPMTILVILSVYFLFQNYRDEPWNSVSWPIFVLAPGLGLLIAYLLSRDRGFLIPGIILTTLAAIFFVIFSVGAATWLVGLLLIIAGVVVLLTRSKRGGE